MATICYFHQIDGVLIFFQVIAFFIFFVKLLKREIATKCQIFNKLVGILMSHLFSIVIDDHFDINISVKMQL